MCVADEDSEAASRHRRARAGLSGDSWVCLGQGHGGALSEREREEQVRRRMAREHSGAEKGVLTNKKAKEQASKGIRSQRREP